MFTKRIIEPEEELTFDYANASGSPSAELGVNDELHTPDQPEGSGRTRCLCGSKGCRGWMPFDESL